MSPEIATHRARADHLLSKLIAGGLSAGVVLLWWPHFVVHDSAVSWVVRGITWTLLAEILVLALSPVEIVLRSRVAGLAPVGRLRGVAGRLHAVAYVVLVAVAIGLPLTLILTGSPAPAAQPRQVTNVTRIVKVVKPVEVKRIVVRKTIRAAAPASPATGTYRPIPAAATSPPPAATSRPTATPTPQHSRTHRSAPQTTSQTQRSTAPDRRDDTGNRAATAPTPPPAQTPAAPTPAPGY